jgi:hypothetical protein
MIYDQKNKNENNYYNVIILIDNMSVDSNPKQAINKYYLADETTCTSEF